MNAKTKKKVTLVFEVGTNAEIREFDFNKIIEEEAVRGEMGLNEGSLRWHLQEVRY